MFELIGGLVEALVGYISGRFQATNKSASHLSMIVISLLFGLIFFIVFAVYELFSPSPKIPENWGYGFALISLTISLFSFLLLEMDFWWKRRKNKSHANSK